MADSTVATRESAEGTVLGLTAQIVAAHVSNNRVDLTRPLCPYPQAAKYSGQGDVRSAANFSCGY